MNTPDSNVLVDVDLQSFLVELDTVRSMVSILLSRLNLSGWGVSVRFVEPEEIRKLNLDFRNVDRSTDVLSFPQQHWSGPIRLGVTDPLSLIDQLEADGLPKILGDIVISVADARKNAVDIGQGLDKEIAFLIIHGLLHLCGHDHEESEQEKIMIELQNHMSEFLSDADKPVWLGCVVSIDNQERPSC